MYKGELTEATGSGDATLKSHFFDVESR